MIAAPVTGQTPVTSVSATDGSYTGTVAWNPGDDSFQEKQCIRQWLLLLQGMAMFSRLEVFPELLWEPFPASVFPRMEKVCLSDYISGDCGRDRGYKKDDSGDGKTSGFHR